MFLLFRPTQQDRYPNDIHTHLLRWFNPCRVGESPLYVVLFHVKHIHRIYIYNLNKLIHIVYNTCNIYIYTHVYIYIYILILPTSHKESLVKAPVSNLPRQVLLTKLRRDAAEEDGGL